MKHSEHNYRLYFGKNSDYYLDVIKELDSGKKNKFNFYAFLLGIAWMLYRKLYLPVFIVVSLVVLEIWVEDYIFELTNAAEGTQSIVDKVSMVIWASLIGLFANRWYINIADRRISEVLSLNLSEAETEHMIQKAGGTTFIPHIIALVIVLIILLLTIMVDYGLI